MASVLAHNQHFGKGRELKPPKKCKMGDVLSKLVQLERITDVSLWQAQTAGRVFVIFWKTSYFIGIGSQFARI